MSKPKVTVIIPVYNAAKYIGRCLDSVLRQSFQDYEILVINDGSTDESDIILKKYVKDYPNKIRYVKQKNIGVAKTRNKAIRMAKGDYVSFIDNDDYVDEDYLKSLVPRGKEDIVISGYRRPDKDGKVRAEVELVDAPWSKFVVVAPWAKVYRTKFLLEKEIEFLDNNIGEDVYFNLIALLEAKKIITLKYAGYNWFYNEQSVSNSRQKDFNKLNVFKLLDKSYNELKSRGLIERNLETLELYYYRYIVWFLLFACKGQSRKNIKIMYRRLFEWLKIKFPEYEDNKLLKARHLAGEVSSTRAIYKTFMFFHKLGLGEALVWLYAKI